MPITTRKATQADAGSIAHIYNEGIEDRIATFETRLRSAEDVAGWFDGVHPIVVAEDGGRIVGFASTSSYRPRECYAKIAQFSVYVAREYRGRGVGRRALEALIEASAARPRPLTPSGGEGNQEKPPLPSRRREIKKDSLSHPGGEGNQEKLPFPSRGGESGETPSPL